MKGPPAVVCLPTQVPERGGGRGRGEPRRHLREVDFGRVRSPEREPINKIAGRIMSLYKLEIPRSW